VLAEKNSPGTYRTPLVLGHGAMKNPKRQSIDCIISYQQNTVLLLTHPAKLSRVTSDEVKQRPSEKESENSLLIAQCHKKVKLILQTSKNFTKIQSGIEPGVSKV